MIMFANLVTNFNPGNNLLELFKALVEVSFPQVKRYFISSIPKNCSRVTSRDRERVKP